MGAALCCIRDSFDQSKCKAEAKMAMARIKLLRNRREVQVPQMRRDVALLLDSGRHDTAIIRVEHVIREQNILAAYELIEVFCELIVARLSVIAKQRECPSDLKEGIASLIYASPRCSEIPELDRIRYIFENKYGKDFVSAAMDLRPDSGVNHMLVEKLSVRKPVGEIKLKTLREIAKENHVSWDATETEQELIVPPKVLEGPCSFVSATSLPSKAISQQKYVDEDKPNASCSNSLDSTGLQFKDSASAAQAAAESAAKAISAARAAAYLSNQQSHLVVQRETLNLLSGHQNISDVPEKLQGFSSTSVRQLDIYGPSVTQVKPPENGFNSQCYSEYNYRYEGNNAADLNGKSYSRSFVEETINLDTKFDDSDGKESDEDEKLVMQRLSPESIRPRPPLSERNHTEGMPSFDSSESLKGNLGSCVHPKLPDYEKLSERFEALKSFRQSRQRT